MNNFKISSKKVYNDSRSTIENLHNEKINDIISKENTLDDKKINLKHLKDKLSLLESNKTINNYGNTIYTLQQEIKQLETEIAEINNNTELIDYIDKAWEFIENFNDSSEPVTQESSSLPDIAECNNKCSNNGNNGNNGNNNILQFITSKGKTTKGEEYNKYYNKCFLNIENHPLKRDCCKNCDSTDIEYDPKNGIIVCKVCSVCEDYFENNYNSINFSDTSHIETISQPFTYQRINHFKEWLNQLQGKEVTVIPDSVIDLVLIEMKKERITNIDDITTDRIKKYLKKLKLNKYYEHIPNLIHKITNKPPLVITAEFEKVLLNLFDKIQEPFKKHCPPTRKNFLSYSYTIHKFCQLLDKKEYLIYFPLLKSREKLFEQEKIWKNICIELNWKFIPSI